MPCGHGEQIRCLLRLLAGGIRLDGPLRLEKGSTWILDLAMGPEGAARYLPPVRAARPAETVAVGNSTMTLSSAIARVPPVLSSA